MCKLEFLERLRNGLSGLPQKDIEERLTFYSEMIDDKMEDGLSEESAVSSIGAVDEIVALVVAEIPLMKIAKERIRSKRRLSTGEVILLALGSPIWFSLGIAAFAVFLSLYISLWGIIVSLWSIFALLSVCSLGGIIAFSVFFIDGNVVSGLAMLAVAFVCIGLSIFMFYACKTATDGTIKLTRILRMWLKNRFIQKEVVQ